MDLKRQGRDRTNAAQRRPCNAVRHTITPCCTQFPHNSHTTPHNPTQPHTPPLTVAAQSRLRESLGISADGSEKCFRLNDIENFENAKPAPLVWQDRDHRKNVKFTFTAVDPSGGGASAFSICTLIVYEGLIQVRCSALAPPYTPSLPLPHLPRPIHHPTSRPQPPPHPPAHPLAHPPAHPPILGKAKRRRLATSRS